MERKAEKDADGNTDRSLFSRIVEAVIIFVVCCFLIKIGVGYLLSVKVPLIIVGAIGIGSIIVWRISKWRRRGDY